MRKKRSIKNAITAAISNIIVLLFGFVFQKVFIQTLGDEYLGLNTLFSNVVSMLSIAELGIGAAIVYSLYEPLAKKETETIKSLLKFYKKTYNIIALSILIISLLLLPFLHYIVTTNLNVNIYLIFILFVTDVVLSYLLSYKRSILQADQRSDIINIVHIMYTVVLNITLIFILSFTKNYILYLIIRCICRVLENIVISVWADKLYPFIRQKSQKLDKEVQSSIFKRVKGLIFHKVSSFIVLGTDNIIISKFLGNITVAYYSSYYLIINAASTLLSQVFTAVTASVGNLLVEKNEAKSYDLFKKLMFLNFWIYGFAGTGMFLAMQSFISLWVGSERLLSFSTLTILVINFYMMGMRASIGVYKDAAGIYYEDRFIPILESILNIVFSLILVKIFGLTGVFVGTFISSLVVVFYSLPYFVFKQVFKRKITEYYKLYFKYAVLFIVSLTLSYSVYIGIVNLFELNNFLISLILAIVIASLIPNTLYLLLFFRSDEFKYFLSMVKTLLKKLNKGFLKH